MDLLRAGEVKLPFIGAKTYEVNSELSWSIGEKDS